MNVLEADGSKGCGESTPSTASLYFVLRAYKYGSLDITMRLSQDRLTASNCSFTASKSYPCPYFDPMAQMDDQPPI